MEKAANTMNVNNWQHQAKLNDHPVMFIQQFIHNKG